MRVFDTAEPAQAVLDHRRRNGPLAEFPRQDVPAIAEPVIPESARFGIRDRQTAQQPEREFWVAKWIVPADAPVGIVRYTITATDPQGRTGEFKPFEVATSQLTIVE